MTGGIQATVSFTATAGCPIADAAAEVGTVVDRVWNSVATADGPPTVSEFVVQAEGAPTVSDAEHVISIGTRHVYRVSHARSATCPCACLGGVGCPPHRYVAGEDALRLVFNAVDYAELQAAIQALRDRFPSLDVRRLVRSPESTAATDAVFVDRGRLTARQLEVLETAYRLGYFDRPRRANATEVAAELDVDPSTLAGHLAAAQSKILGDVLEAGPG